MVEFAGLRTQHQSSLKDVDKFVFEQVEDRGSK